MHGRERVPALQTSLIFCTHVPQLPKAMLLHRSVTARSAIKTSKAFLQPCSRGVQVRTFAAKQRVRVIETSLGVQDNIKLLRHLGLRVGEDDEDFVEAHFGPGEDGQMSEGACPKRAHAQNEAPPLTFMGL